MVICTMLAHAGVGVKLAVTLLKREQPPLISAKVHAVRHSALEECDLGDGHAGPVFADNAVHFVLGGTRHRLIGLA